MTTLASDTFTGANGSAWSASWAAGLTPAGGSAQIQGNAGRLTTGSTGGYAGASRVSRVSTITNPTNAVWTSRVRFLGDEVYPLIYLRGSNNILDGDGGYYVALNAAGSTWDVGRGVAFSNTSLSGAQPFTFTTNQWYWVIFGVFGTSIRFQIWQDGSTQPSTWSYATTDATISAAGWVGATVGVGNVGSGRFEIDDVTITDTLPALPGAGPPVVVGKLEVEFVPGSGTYVDLSSRCLSMEIVHPPARPEGMATPTMLTAVLDNSPDSSGFCPLTPDSPVAARYPNVERDRRVRGSAVVGGSSTYVRFWGWSDTWVPDASDGNPDNSTVTLTASCVLGRYARRKVLSEYGERLTQITLSDYWPYDEDSDAATLRGICGDGVAVPDALVIPSAQGTGAMSLSKPDSTILVDGAAEFSRGDGSGSSASPVILHRLRDGQMVGRVSAWVRLAVDPAGADDDVFGLYKADGSLVWRLVAGITAGKVVWQIIDSAATVRTFWDSGVPRDDAWHWLSVIPVASGAGTNLAIRDKSIPDRIVAGYIPSYPDDTRAGTWLVAGGRMAPNRPGKQTNTLQGSISSMHVQYALTTSSSDRSAAGVTYDAATRASFLSSQSASIDALVGGGVGSASADATPVMFTGANTTLLDSWTEHALTVGAVLSTQPDGRRRFVVASLARPLSPAIVLDANADLHVPAGGWVGLKDERPTRVTSTAPVGSVTAIDTVAEALTGLRLEGSTLATSAGTIAVARSAAAWVMASRGARLTFGVDAGLTSTDRTAELMALQPGDRVRISGLPTAYTGISSYDVYAAGWTETYIAEGRLAQFVFDSDPADDPPEAVFDSAEYGRFAMDSTSTVTGGTCVGSTGTGTVIITTTSPLTTTGAEYPMDLDWNGERITISGVGGAVSPQTATVTARGVAPSVARVHTSGESVDVYHAARFAR